MNKLQQLAAVAALAASAAQAAPVIVDVSGASSIGLQGEAGNTVWLIDVGAGAQLKRLDWSVTLEAFAPSLLSEMQFSFGDSSGWNLLTLAPGAADAASGSASYSGTLDLSAYGLAAGTDGLLRIEFSELYKDLAAGQAEGRWLGGTLAFDAGTLPEPASLGLALCALGLLGARRRAAS